jgi:hypothetical protein
LVGDNAHVHLARVQIDAAVGSPLFSVKLIMAVLLVRDG